MKLLLYCTKAKPYLIFDDLSGDYNDMCVGGEMFATQYKDELWNPEEDIAKSYNGKVVGECDFEVEEIYYGEHQDLFWTNSMAYEGDILQQSRLKHNELIEYLEPKDSYYGKSGYAIHIKNLNIFYKTK